MKRFVLSISLCLFVSFTIHAQDAEVAEAPSADEQYSSVTVVFSQNKCHYGKIDKLYKMVHNKLGAIHNEVVETGLWLEWGILSHDWGDEWNWNSYYVARDKNTFNEGWDLFVKLVNEKYPDIWDTWAEYCWEHKDNIYHQSVGSDFPLKPKEEKKEEEGK